MNFKSNSKAKEIKETFDGVVLGMKPLMIEFSE